MNEHLPADQSQRNVAQALRVATEYSADELSIKALNLLLERQNFEAAMLLAEHISMDEPAGVIPSPRVIVLAEIENAKRYAS